MTFNEALDSFLAGQIDYASFSNALKQAVQANPSSRESFEKAFDDLYREGRLPPQIYHGFKQVIEEAAAQSQEELDFMMALRMQAEM